MRQRVSYVAQAGRAPDWMTLEDLCRYSAHFFERWDSGLAREMAGRWELPWSRPLGRLSRWSPAPRRNSRGPGVAA